MTRAIYATEAERLARRADVVRRRQILEKRMATIRAHYGTGGIGSTFERLARIRMVVTPWRIDALGNVWREIYAE
jgi:hypothetical protein